MYFVILGKNKKISLKELDLVGPSGIRQFKNIAMFEASSPEYFGKLGGIIKRGEIISDYETIENRSLVGTNDMELGKQLKREYGFKRFKLVEPDKTDLEVKNVGVEIFRIEENKIGLIKGYQDINLYEVVDFEKPMRGMEIGMMPSKLTHILINIGASNLGKSLDSITIYDPFAGFGTTGFVANNLGYDFIGSDINITQFKQNLKWWESHKLHDEKKRMMIFKHDINQEFDKGFLKNVDVIVTEGWLGPVINHRTTPKALQDNQDKIYELYKNFITNVDKFYDTIKAVFTIPVYMNKDNFLGEMIKGLLDSKGIKYEFLDEIYARKGQLVGRQIVILSKKK